MQEPLNLDRFDYVLPESQIAQKPMSPRDHSKLMVIDTRDGSFKVDRFRNLHQHLPSSSLLILNQTEVLPCRVYASTSNGKPVELLIVTNEWKPEDTILKATASRHLKPGESIITTGGHELIVLASHEKVFKFHADFPLRNLPAVLKRIGEMPVPKYIAACPLTEAEKRQKYQTVFAKKPGSVAAPTASLHFTKRVFKNLEEAKIELATLTLHIGLGTFAPVLPEHFATQTLYEEFYEISPETEKKIHEAKSKKRPCIAVGTTATRALESWAKKGRATGTTDLFITPPYDFKILDGLLTNFHIPKSSLMMLVQAFLEHKKCPKELREFYQIAIQNEFRFYSFGDAMLIL